MAELSDDLILEIVARLPLKYAIRCSVLNKNIHRCVSHPNFSPLPHHSTIIHCSGSRLHGSKTFANIGREIRSTAVDPLRRSKTLDEEVSIIASCNGLLLLCFPDFSDSYCVFNPTTSAIMPVQREIDYCASVGLALPPEKNSRFKLVAVYVLGTSNESTYLEFRVIVPSPSDESLLVKSTVSFDCRQSFRLATVNDNWPIYAHGSLYWLGNSGRAMVAFDVEEEEARLIDGPIGENERQTGESTWFGFTDSEIHFVYVSFSEIVICRHDRLTDAWREKSRIKSHTYICNCYMMWKPLFFDGRRVLFLLRGRKRGEAGHVYSYDLSTDVWEWESFDSGDVYFSYTPTIAKVSDTYLDRNITCTFEYSIIRNALLELQKLMRPGED